MSAIEPSKVYIVILHDHYDDYKTPSTSNTIKFVFDCRETAYMYAVTHNLRIIMEDMEDENDDDKIKEILGKVVIDLDDIIPQERNWKILYDDLLSYIDDKMNIESEFTEKPGNIWFTVEIHNCEPKLSESDLKDKIKEFGRKNSRFIRDKYKLPECTYDEDGNNIV